jgi:hypothetical protein
MSIYNNLYERYKSEFQIYESLIISHPLYRVILLLDKKYDVKSNYKNNTFSLRYEFDTVEAVFELNKILKLTNNLGWFPTNMSSYNIYNKFKQLNWDEDLRNFKQLINNNYTNILFSFEAKHDIPAEKFPDILYHICELKYKNKILNIGLVPRSRSKKAFHPERVYLCKNINDIYKFVEEFLTLDDTKDLAILKIDVFFILDYLKLYQDPNFMDRGYYTLNNIPPDCITCIEEIKFN